MDQLPLLALFVLASGLAVFAVSGWRRARRLERRLLDAEARGRRDAAADARDAAARDIAALEDLVPVGVLRISEDRRITGANSRAHQLLDVGAGRLVGRTVMEAFRSTHLEAVLDGVPPGGTTTADARLGRQGARAVVVRASRPTPRELLVLVEDVGELQRLRQIRSEFIDNLSHELRTPLTTVSLLAETASREAELADVPQRLRDRISRIEVETGHLVQMVNELLDLARIEGGSQLRLEDDLDLGRLATASTERLRLFAERQGVSLAVDVAPGLPRVRGDGERLGQVIVNLVHNAVKFSPDGGEVRVVVRRAGDMAEALVVDHGIGIGPADVARIFERFYKVDRARVRGGGTGLGLAIARHIVEGHGGRIGVESEEGAGSTFRVLLPFAGPPAPTGTDTDQDTNPEDV